MEAEEAGAMEVVQGVLLHLPYAFRPAGPRAQCRHERRGATHRLVVVDLGEAANGHARIPAVAGIAAWGILE